MVENIWNRQEPLEDDVAFEIVRTAQFSLALPHRVTPAERKLIELIIRRWTAVGYWLDLNLLGKGDRNKYPLALPGARAEESWAEVMEALLKLCIACHPYRKLSTSYYWPIHLWLAVVNDIAQDDINAVFEPCLKKATIKGRRKFINALKRNQMPPFEDWGPFEHSYRLFKTTVEVNKCREKSPKFITAREIFIQRYEANLTAYDRDSKAKAALIHNDAVMVQLGRRPITTGWKPSPLPRLPANFWDSHQS